MQNLSRFTSAQSPYTLSRDVSVLSHARRIRELEDRGLYRLAHDLNEGLLDRIRFRVITQRGLMALARKGYAAIALEAKQREIRLKARIRGGQRAYILDIEIAEKTRELRDLCSALRRSPIRGIDSGRLTTILDGLRA